VFLKNSSLYAKLSIVLLVLFLVVGGVTHILTLWTSQKYLQEVQQRINLGLAEHITAEKLLIRDGEIAEESVHDVFHMMMVINPSIELYLLDPSGRILGFSAPPGRVRLSNVSLGPIERLLAHPSRLPILGDDPRHPERRNIFNVAPITRDDVLEGYLYIVLASEQYASVVDLLRGSYILRTATLALAGVVVGTLVGALLLFGRVTRRLRELSRRMATFQRETLMPPDDRDAGDGLEEPRDELERLRSTYERMANRIEEQIGQLEHQDRLRRDLVANVSHDLRTPLTHLQGYLETLRLKEGGLEEAERREYLEIALQHAERLSRLVTDLFDLAKLDTLEELVERERLPVGELVQDVTQKYRRSADERGITLEANLEGGPTLISADVGLMERALENVLENALRHTPSGGRITVSIRPHDGMLRIDINDTGPGIADSDLPRIFDRFYRLQDAATVGDPRGAGLGLAIAKRAVELHGGNLLCESPVGAGTTFSFELPTL
jgi:signal transduction histidine kinase